MQSDRCAYIRSASSSTMYSTRDRSSSPLSAKSLQRPGVATTISAPARSSIACWPRAEPPNKVMVLMPAPRYLRDSPAICCANSRVGAITSALGGTWRERLACTTAVFFDSSMFRKAGNRKPRVLPTCRTDSDSVERRERIDCKYTAREWREIHAVLHRRLVDSHRIQS